MKKVIKGSLYDTDTAKKLGNFSYGNPRDFSHFRETLYRTRSGKYFIHGEGGPMSKYAVSTGQNEWSGGEHIEPVSIDTAREWAEKYLNADEYAEIFGEPGEAADGKEFISASIRPETRQKIDRLRSETGKSIGEIIDGAFAE